MTIAFRGIFCADYALHVFNFLPLVSPITAIFQTVCTEDYSVDLYEIMQLKISLLFTLQEV